MLLATGRNVGVKLRVHNATYDLNHSLVSAV